MLSTLSPEFPVEAAEHHGRRLGEAARRREQLAAEDKRRNERLTRPEARFKKPAKG